MREEMCNGCGQQKQPQEECVSERCVRIKNAFEEIHRRLSDVK